MNKIKNYYGNLSIKKKLLYTLLPIILLQAILIFVSSNYIASSHMVKQTRKHLEDVCVLIATQLTHLHQEAELNINVLIKDINEIKTAYAQNNSKSSVALKNLCYSVFNYHSQLFENIDSYLYYDIETDQCISYHSENALESDAVITNYISKLETFGIPGFYTFNMDYHPALGISSEPVIAFAKRVIDIQTGNNLGYVIILIRESTFFSVYMNFEQSYFLLDANGRIISSAEKESLLTTPSNKKILSANSKKSSGSFYLNSNHGRQEVTYHYLESMDATLFSHVSNKAVFSEIIANTFLIILFTALTTGLAIYLIVKNCNQFVRPILNLTAALKLVRKEDLNIHCPVYGRDEVSVMTQHFNHMTDRIQALIKDIELEQHLKHKSELLLLHAQIDSHFFYNTLDLIYVLCQTGESKNAAKMIKALADFYRYSLNNGRDVIPLRQEFYIIKNYLAIQSERYIDLITYSITIDDNVSTVPIPKMTLQPLVENAIYHGLKESGKKDRILKLQAVQKDDSVEITLSDNGAGMSREKVIELMSNHDSNVKQFGIYNIRKRLSLFYEDKYSMNITSQPGIGTEISITIPYSALSKQENANDYTNLNC